MNAIRALCVGFYLTFISIEAYRYRRELNIRKCKLTHSGVEYRGNVFTSKFKSLCRPWNSIGTEHDSDFADGSRMSAKNYCRNPNGTRDDLWCYTYNPDNPVESCAVPLCKSYNCRITGPGVEYGGDVNTTKSGDACLRWTSVYGTAADSSIVAVESKFPDGSRAAAGNRCRNPTGDSGGPWCYVSVDGATVPDYCETSDCDGPGCSDWTLIGAAGDATVHGHYTSIVAQDQGDPGSGVGGGEASFELKAWDPASGRGRSRPFRISLTAYPIGYRGPSGDGFEVPVPAEVFVRSPDEPVRVHLSWRNGLVVLTRAVGRPREVLSFELNGTLTPVTYVSFAAGDRSAPVAVRFPECDQTATGCEEHVTNNQYVYRIFPLRKTMISNSELSFSVRAVISVSITYYTAPAKLTPCLIITIAARPKKQIKIIYNEQSTNEEQLIFQQSYEKDILLYWEWHQCTITIVGKTLQMKIINKRYKNPIVILNITDYKLRFFHWFSIGSNTVAHWTLYCNGPENHPLPKAALPECSISKSDFDYRGTQWIDGDGKPCVPWNVSSVRKSVKESALIDGSYMKAKNYCRNPSKDSEGPYCFVAIGNDRLAWTEAALEKRFCHVQKCQNTKCSMAGIATDYIGTLNKTVSNRTCVKWSGAVKNGGDKKYVFPDGSESWSTNYCRNPTAEPTGAWCHVTDGNETDLCDVPGCSNGGAADDDDDDNNSSGTLLTGGGGVHWLHVLPEWRNAPPGLRIRLKRWAPGVHRGTVSLRFRRANDLRRPSVSYDVLRVGGEKIELFRAQGGGGGNGSASAQLVYPHLVMASRWTELLFEFVQDAAATVAMSSEADGEIIRWAGNSGNTSAGRVAYLGLSAEGDRDYYVGARFPSEECLVHSSESNNFSVFLPINVRTNKSLTTAKNEIVFRMRHTGVVRIALIKRTLGERYVLEIGGNRTTLSREGSRWPGGKILDEKKTDDIGVGSHGDWTRIYISWNESVLRLNVSGGIGNRQWNHFVAERPLLIRYFSVANRGGRATWTVNCDERWRPLPDVDGPPVDGGWSEWGEWNMCTKTCGGGTGVRRRRCDSPRPNLSGQPCAGPTTAVGKCNEHECGHLSAKTVAMVRTLLTGRAHNVVVAAGGRLTVSCDRPTVDVVRVDSPGAQFSWLRNGRPVQPSTVETADDRCTLIINSCSTQDSGVYAFVVQPQESEMIVLKLYAVSIYDKPILVYIKDSIPVQCNAITLGYLFIGLSQEWIVNDSYVIKTYGTNSLASVYNSVVSVVLFEKPELYSLGKCYIDTDIIIIENIHYQGIWKCIVKSVETNTTWITHQMEVKIGISTIWTRMMQDPIINIIFQNSSPKIIVLVCSTFIISLCISIWSCACKLNKWRNQLLEQNRRPRHNISYHRL